MAKLVKHYAVAWNPKENTGTIAVHLADGSKPVLAIDSAQEMAAVGVVLAQAPVFMDGDTLKSGWEVVPEDGTGA